MLGISQGRSGATGIGALCSSTFAKKAKVAETQRVRSVRHISKNQHYKDQSQTEFALFAFVVDDLMVVLFLFAFLRGKIKYHSVLTHAWHKESKKG